MKTVNSDKRIHRIMSQSVISGVCAGLARYLGVDALWVRIAAGIALFMLPGITVIAYIAAVMLLPRWA
ncbi:PspC domain-containing protein [Salinimonas sediminis]|uniref:PspC domain-containing protein n=1 Tax=Salinimonas sediminis TaxID=2303538 RepID=A0A346NQC5_9ALTE|nr:PspC domain-containing protein [Salinimonas sediminis]AXR07732.1 PspC domain-containing protein [Salinimonas sediminis]